VVPREGTNIEDRHAETLGAKFALEVKKEKKSAISFSQRGRMEDPKVPARRGLGNERRKGKKCRARGRRALYPNLEGGGCRYLNEKGGDGGGGE